MVFFASTKILLGSCCRTQKWNIAKIIETKLDENDPKSKCARYDLHEKYRSSKNCFANEIKTIFPDLQGSTPPLFGQNEVTICKNVKPENPENLDYVPSFDDI